MESLMAEEAKVDTGETELNQVVVTYTLVAGVYIDKSEAGIRKSTYS